jgi:hypothetical protein
MASEYIVLGAWRYRLSPEFRDCERLVERPSPCAECGGHVEGTVALCNACAEPPCDCDRTGILGSHEDHCATVVY